MTKPMRLDEFTRLPPTVRVEIVDGLSAAIDAVAEAGPTTHAFLRHQWFAAALAAYGGEARTLVATEDARAVLAMPVVPIGPRALGLVAVPGCYWPFRSFPADAASDAVQGAALDTLGHVARGLRIGPVYDGDASVAPLLAAARARGWTVLDRFVADSFVLDMAALRAEGTWPRGSTLRKNRFHEKHLADHGATGWRFLSGEDWPAGFDTLAAVERKSWISERTDGGDAKFLESGHGAFWRGAVRDPMLAKVARAALLTVDGAPAAFSFDLDLGDLKYAIANSYDQAFSKHSPGKLLYYRNLVQALGEGITRVDWGAGDAGYKRVIGAERGPAIRDWLLIRPGLAWAGRLAAGVWKRSGN